MHMRATRLKVGDRELALAMLGASVGHACGTAALTDQSNAPAERLAVTSLTVAWTPDQLELLS